MKVFDAIDENDEVSEDEGEEVRKSLRRNQVHKREEINKENIRESKRERKLTEKGQYRDVEFI